MRAFFFFLTAIAALGLAGCTPESKNGLPEEFRIAPDARFIGAWRGGNETGLLQGSEVTGEVTADKAEPLDLLLNGHESWRTTRAVHQRDMRARLRFYELSGRRIVGFLREDGAPGERTWRFATYRFGGDDSLALFFLDEQRFYVQLRNGLLAGVIRGGEPEFPDVLITAEPDKLAAAIRGGDPAATFTVRLGPLARVKS